MPTSAVTAIQSTTQEFIDIFDITNDLVIMKDGSTALILTVDAMNFGLLAEEEQDAVMYAYAGLLNSLNYSVQIVIRSQTKDATNYLNLLRDQEQSATSEVKRQFIREYRDFVANLIRERNVLDKKFYIAIPATTLEMGLLPPSTVIPGMKKVDISSVERSVILDKAKTILEPKRDHLISQFSRIGLYARQLQTQEIIQLFYTSYNPEAAEGQQITDTRNYVTPIVEAATTTTYTPTAPQVVPQTATPMATQPAQTEAVPLATPQPTYVPGNETLLATPPIYEQPPAIVDVPLPSDVQQNITHPPVVPPAVTQQVPSQPVTPPLPETKPTPVPTPPPFTIPSAAPTAQPPAYREMPIYPPVPAMPAPTPLPPVPPQPMPLPQAPVDAATPATTFSPAAALPPIPEIT